MPRSMTVDQAASRLSDLVLELGADQEILLTQQDQVVAKLVGKRLPRKARTPGNCEGMLTINSDDDEHLADFKDYMP